MVFLKDGMQNFRFSWREASDKSYIIWYFISLAVKKLKLSQKLAFLVFSLQLTVKTVTLERSGCLWIGTVNGSERAIPELSPADNRRWRIFSG